MHFPKLAEQNDSAAALATSIRDDPLDHRVGILVLAEPENCPARLSQSIVHVAIAADVLINLLRPERRVRRRVAVVLRATVPEAPVDDYDQPRPREQDLVAAPTIDYERMIDPEAVPRRCKARRTASSGPVSRPRFARIVARVPGLDTHDRPNAPFGPRSPGPPPAPSPPVPLPPRRTVPLLSCISAPPGSGGSG